MARKRKYRAIYTVHYAHYRFEAGEEFTSDDLKPPKDADPALEPLPERELRDWLESGRVVDITPKRKPRKKKAAKTKAAASPSAAGAASDPEVREARVSTGINVPRYASWRKEGMKP